MPEKLGQLKLDTLLEKFGAGGHKPGAGSAAALQGMVSAKLLKTVIELTLDRGIYKDNWLRLRTIEAEVETSIYPRLQALLQEDSEQFDKVIELRNARNEEKNIIRKSELATEALEAQKPATEIPLEIAKHCIKLAGFAIEIFDKGFQSARGDSSVAINCAISSVGGCLSIVDLNLLSFGTDEWTEQIRLEADLIKTAHANLLSEASERQQVLNSEAEQTSELHSELNALQSDIQKAAYLSNANIERIAIRLQNTLWKFRELIWKGNLPQHPIEILKAKKAILKLGYQFETVDQLGVHTYDGDRFEIAAIIDGKKKYVTISNRFKPEVKNFTAAHELGHALLHPNLVLHRDKPLDGSDNTTVRDLREKQADKFASYFLMPKKQLKDLFRRRFFSEKFQINEQTALSLGYKISDLRRKCREVRDLSRLLASTTFYDRPFGSLAQQFGVSVEAMAIRLEELGLIGL